MKRHEDNRFDQEIRNKVGDYSTPMTPYIWDKVLSDVEVLDATVSHWWKWAAVILFTAGFGFRIFNLTPEASILVDGNEQVIEIYANESKPFFKVEPMNSEFPENTSIAQEARIKRSVEEVRANSSSISVSSSLDKKSLIGFSASKEVQNLNSKEGVDSEKESKVESVTDGNSAPSQDIDLIPPYLADRSATNEVDRKSTGEKNYWVEDKIVEDQLPGPRENLLEKDIVESDNPEAREESIQESPYQDESISEESNDLRSEIEFNSSQDAKWGIEILFGPSISYRTFDSESNPELVSHKNSNDRSMLSANMSLMIRRYLEEGLSIATGIQTFNCGERYSYTVNSAAHNFDNAYNYISIPVEVDYRIVEKSDLSLELGLGVQYNHLREGTSSWVDLDSARPVTHNNKGAQSPFSESTIGLNSDVTARYSISPRIDLMAQPRAVVFTGSLYKEETGLDQRPYALSMMFGVSADF